MPSAKTKKPRVLRERDIECALCAKVKALGGEVRKVQWVGRNFAPDRVAMLPIARGIGHDVDTTIWVEVKNPETIRAFPADARERAQAREHARMRRRGQRVEVIGTLEQIEELFS